MAGPFDSGANSAAGIQSVNATGGFSAPAAAADDGTIGAINAVGAAVQNIGEVNNKRLETEAVANIRKEVQSVRDALAISRKGTASDEFTSEALKDPYVQQVFKQFNEISAAAWQGVYPQDIALERMDSALSDAVNRRPQFADAIRKAANEAAGANISAKFYDQLTKLTPEQEAQAQLREEAAYYGISEATMRGVAQQQFVREQAMAEIEYNKAQGTVTLGELRSQANMLVFDLTDRLQGALRVQVRQGGVQDVAQYKQFVSEEMQVIRQSVLNGIPSSVASSDVNATIRALDDHEARLLRQIDNGSMQTIATANEAVYGLRTKQNARQANPELMMLIDAFPEGVGLKLWEDRQRILANPEKNKALLESLQGGQLNAADRLIESAYNSGLIINGDREPANDQERRDAGVVAAQELQLGGTTNTGQSNLTPQRAVRLVDAVNNMGLDYSMVALSDNKVANTLKGYKEVHDQLINVYKRAESSLQFEYNQLKAKGYLNDGDITLQGGRLFVDYAQDVVNLEAGERASRSSAIESFIKNGNITLKMGQTYQSKGVFPTTVFQSADGLLKSIVNQEFAPRQEAGETDESPVYRYDLDADGNIVPLE